MTDKPNIRDAVLRYIYETPGAARFDVQSGRAGVVFTDEGEFIPLADLAYSRELGFYQISQFPDVEPETTNENPWTLHPAVPVWRDDPWRPYALLSPEGHGFLIGEKWQLVEAVEAIRLFIERGLLSEPIREDDEALGHKWLSISEAVAEANAYDPAEYPLGETTAARIRQAARRETIGGAVQDGGGRWKFQNRRFRHWLIKNAERKQR